MSKRLFALLLAAALVLSMGAAPAVSGQPSGTEQTEQGGELSAQAPDAAELAGDTVDGTPAGENGEDVDGNDAAAGGNDTVTDGDGAAADGNDVTADGDDSAADGNDATVGEDSAPTADEADPAGDENGEVTGEKEAAPENSASPEDEGDADGGEPQAMAEAPASVSVRFEGAEHILSLTAEGVDVLAEAKEGTPIVAPLGDYNCATFGIELEEGYDVKAPSGSSDMVVHAGSFLYVYDYGPYSQVPGDGNATVRVVVLPKIKLSFTGETDKIISFMDGDTDHTASAKAGGPVEMTASVNTGVVSLPLILEEHYTAKVTGNSSYYNGYSLYLNADSDESGDFLPVTELGVEIARKPTLEVTFTGETGKIVRFQDAAGNDVTADAQAGKPVTMDVESLDRTVTLSLELAEGHTVMKDADASDSVRYSSSWLYIDDDGDGKVTVRIAASPRVDVTFAGETDKIISLTKLNGTDCLAQAKAGTPVTLFATSMNEQTLSMNMELAAGYTVRLTSTGGTSSDSYIGSYNEIYKQLNISGPKGEGAVTGVTVTVVSAPKLTVLFEGVEGLASVTDVYGTTSYDPSEPLELYPAGTNGAVLRIVPKDGYYVEGKDEYLSSTSYTIDGQRVTAYVLVDRNGDGAITVQVKKLVKVTIVDNDGYITRVSGGGYSQTENTFEIRQGQSVSINAKLCALDVVGGTASSYPYYLDRVTGVVYIDFEVRPNDTGDVTIRTVAAEVPVPVKIEYDDPENRILDKDKEVYALPGSSFSLRLAEGYTIEAEGDVESYGYGGFVLLTEDARYVKVTAVPRKTGATVLFSVPEAAAETDPFDMSSTVFCMDMELVSNCSTLTDGHGYFALENGYEVGPGVTGGCVSNWPVHRRYDSTTGRILTYYHIEATDSTVNVPIVPVRPFRWVHVKSDNAVGAICVFSGYMIGEALGNEIYDEGTGIDVVIPAKDDIGVYVDPYYELVAVSGCAVLHESPMGSVYGNQAGWLNYSIIPDEDGDTNIEVMVVRALEDEEYEAHVHTWGDWERFKDPTFGSDGEDRQVCDVCGAVRNRVVPALDVKTDAGVSSDVDGLQVDARAEDKMKGAIGDVMETLTKGGIPDGMSRETANKLRGALENVDPDGPAPVVSAELTVKPADSGVLKGADAVYEIEIGLSVNGEKVGVITELSQAIAIGLPLPEEIAGRIVYVVRSHDGKQEKLAVVVKDGTITFATNQFSDFAIMSSSDLADAVVAPIPDQTWTGSELRPAIKVTIMGPDGEETLAEGVDYELVYKDNVKTGTATVTVKGLGDFAGTSITATFDIVTAPAPDETAKPADTAKPAGTAGPGIAPATGDSTPLALYAALLAVSLCGLTAILLRRGKQR